MRYEELNIGTAVIETEVRAASHLAGGLGMSMSSVAADIVVDSAINELVLFTADGLVLSFKDKNGVVKAVTAV